MNQCRPSIKIGIISDFIRLTAQIIKSLYYIQWIVEFRDAGCSSGSEGIMEDATDMDYEECRYCTELKHSLLVAPLVPQSYGSTIINGCSTV